MTTTRRRIIENYSLHQLIGEGVYGKVYRAKHKNLSEDFAIKVIPVQLFSQNKKLQECTINEINTLSNIKKSPHIVKYVEMLKTPNNFYFVYEYCNGGTLEGMLKKHKTLPETQALDVFRQLLKAFKILNSHNIMHRDIKPDNILFHNGVVKLGDFGFCKNLVNNNDMTATMLGSPIYMAPEVLKGEPYTSKADIWSLGVVLFEMLFGYCPYQSNSIANLISTIKDTQLKLPLEINSVSEQIQYLIRKMLIKDERHRIEWKQIFETMLSEGNQETATKILKLGESQSKIISSIKESYEKQKERERERERERQREKQKERERQREREKSKQRQRQKSRQRDNISPYTKKFSYQNYRQREKLKQKQNQIRSCSVDKKIFHETHQITSSVTSSLNWQTDEGFKNFLANKNLKSLTSKFPVDSSLPVDAHSSSNKLGHYNNYFNPSAVTASVISSINYSQNNSASTNATVGASRRKDIIQEHEFCTKGIKTSIDIISIDDRSSIVYSYLILLKVQSRLRKIIQQINTLQLEYQDIVMTIDSQLRNIQKSIQQLKQQLMDQGVDFRNLEDPKIYLSVKFRENNTEAMRVWYDMVNIILGNRSVSGSRDKGKQEMVDFINERLGLNY